MKIGFSTSHNDTGPIEDYEYVSYPKKSILDFTSYNLSPSLTAGYTNIDASSDPLTAYIISSPVQMGEASYSYFYSLVPGDKISSTYIGYISYIKNKFNSTELKLTKNRLYTLISFSRFTDMVYSFLVSYALPDYNCISLNGQDFYYRYIVFDTFENIEDSPEGSMFNVHLESTFNIWSMGGFILFSGNAVSQVSIVEEAVYSEDLDSLINVLFRPIYPKPNEDFFIGDLNNTEHFNLKSRFNDYCNNKVYSSLIEDDPELSYYGNNFFIVNYGEHISVLQDIHNIRELVTTNMSTLPPPNYLRTTGHSILNQTAAFYMPNYNPYAQRTAPGHPGILPLHSIYSQEVDIVLFLRIYGEAVGLTTSFNYPDLNCDITHFISYENAGSVYKVHIYGVVETYRIISGIIHNKTFSLTISAGNNKADILIAFLFCPLNFYRGRRGET